MSSLRKTISAEVIPPPVGGNDLEVTTFALTSTSGGTNLPYTIGHAFKQGDVPAGRYVKVSGAQADIINAWPDGSAKFAVISGAATLSANVAQTLSVLSSAVASGGTPLTLAQIRSAIASGSLVFSAGVTATVNIATVLAGAPHRTRFAGPQMIEAHWRAPVGTDAHLVAWFYVRYYAGGQAEVETVIENGYRNVASPTRKTYTANLTLNGTSRFNSAVTHEHHTRWSRVDWYGTDPEIRPSHNLAYLKATKLVPNVPAATPSAAAWTGSGNWNPTLSAPATEANSGAPFSRGNFRQDNSAGGDSASIGIIPAWEALYLSSGDARAYTATLINARNFGRYPLCYRDESTVRGVQHAPMQMTQYPGLGLGANSGWNYNSSGAASDTDLPANLVGPPPDQLIDIEHQPSAGYLAYLLTGRWPFMESCQFAASSSLLWMGNGRVGASCLIRSYETSTGPDSRGTAWALRQIAWAAAVTPDSDTTLQSEYRTIFDNNIAYHYGLVTTGATANNLGLIAFDFEDRIGGYSICKPWMQSYLITVLGQAYDLQINGSAGTRATHQSLLTEAYKFTVGLHGTAGGFNYRRAGMYRLPYATGGTGNGPRFGATFLADWGAVYTATLAVMNPYPTNPGSFAAISFAEGLSLSNMVHTAFGGPPAEIPITSAGQLPVSYNAQIAHPLAYAVDHGASGALAAYTRLTGSSSWASFSGEFADSPKWQIVPRASAVPSWVPAAGTWAQVSLNTVDATVMGDFPPRFPSSRSIAAKSVNFSGAIWNPYMGNYGAWVFWGGGHSATELGNEIYVWEADTRLWRRVTNPTYPGDVSVSPNWTGGENNADFDEPLRTYGELAFGVPAAAHSRWNISVLPPGSGIGSQGALALPFLSAFHIGGNTQSAQAHIYDFAAAAWSRKGDVNNTYLGGWTGCGDTNGNLWRAVNDGSVQKLAAGASAWTRYTPSGWSGTVGVVGPICYVPNHDLIAAWRINGGVLRLYLLDAANPSSAVVVPTLSGTPPAVSAAPGYGSQAPEMGMTWCEPLRAIVGFLEGSKQVWALRAPTNPLTQAWTWQQLTASNTPTPFTGSGGGDPVLYNRFQYAPALRSFIVTRQMGNSEMWAFRPSELA